MLLKKTPPYSHCAVFHGRLLLLLCGGRGAVAYAPPQAQCRGSELTTLSCCTRAVLSGKPNCLQYSLSCGQGGRGRGRPSTVLVRDPHPNPFGRSGTGSSRAIVVGAAESSASPKAVSFGTGSCSAREGHRARSLWLPGELGQNSGRQSWCPVVW